MASSNTHNIGNTEAGNNLTGFNYRKTSQFLMPAFYQPSPVGIYDIYPSHDIGENKIGYGFDALAKELSNHSIVIIDGFVGVLWDRFRKNLNDAFLRLGASVNWIDISKSMKSEDEIDKLAEPFLGGDDPLFGFRFIGSLADFFESSHLSSLNPDGNCSVNIIYGCGAALAGWSGFLVYIDIPKIEIQYRSRAGSIVNLGMSKPIPTKEQYKRFYFVDWVALNKHRAELLPQMDLLIDEQRSDEPTFISGYDFRDALNVLGKNSFRVRPWFEAGPWGGTWILDHIPSLSRDVPNYAWSFELIAPENGLIFRSGNLLFEASSDFFMFQEYKNILGYSADIFKYEFPIRYDFLDTFDGGNLSIQCHPRSDYIKEKFGETFTQHEAYYILDCKDDSKVYLGFKAGINPYEFRDALEESFKNSTTIDADKFVNSEKSKKHDFFLIPGGTIHGSGKNNLVLEISSTPYIFTFKMYDWMRMDLDGKPRPLNISRAFDNLYFERQGNVIKEEHISKQTIKDEGNGWKVISLSTHKEQFYQVERLEFTRPVKISTNGSPQVMSLVEGKTVLLETRGMNRRRFNYAETFAVSAAAEEFWLIPENNEEIKVVITFLKKEIKI